MMIRRFLAAGPRTRAAAAAHRRAHLHHVFWRLTPRHPEVAHQHIRHVRGQPVANRRLASDLSVEHHVDLLARETLGHENIDQPGQAYFAARAVHDCYNFGAWRADAPDESRTLTAIDASHQELGRLDCETIPEKSLKRPCARKFGGPASFLRLLPGLDGRKYERAHRHEMRLTSRTATTTIM